MSIKESSRRDGVVILPWGAASQGFCLKYAPSLPCGRAPHWRSQLPCTKAQEARNQVCQWLCEWGLPQTSLWMAVAMTSGLALLETRACTSPWDHLPTEAERHSIFVVLRQQGIWKQIKFKSMGSRRRI